MPAEPALPGAAPRSTELQEAELQTGVQAEEPHIIEPLRVTTGGASSAVVVQGRLVTNTRDAPLPEAATPALALSGLLERDTVSLDEQRLGCIAHIAARAMSPEEGASKPPIDIVAAVDTSGSMRFVSANTEFPSAATD